MRKRYEIISGIEFKGEAIAHEMDPEIVFCCAVLFRGNNAPAQQEDKPKDAEGCKDSALITRFPGSIISSCDNKEYERADFPLADDKVKHVEGEYHSWDSRPVKG